MVFKKDGDPGELIVPEIVAPSLPHEKDYKPCLLTFPTT